MLRVCPHCPHKASTAWLLLRYTPIKPGNGWSIFTFLIYESRDQQGLWSIWFSRVSPALHNSWLGKAACCTQGWGKTPPSHPLSSSLRVMWIFSGPHHPGLEMAFTSWTHCCLMWVLCLTCFVKNTAFELHFDDLHRTRSQGCGLTAVLQGKGLCHSSTASLGTAGAPARLGLGTVGKANER